MYKKEHLQLKKQRKNALQILKKWEMDLNQKKELEKNANLTEIKAKLISNKEYGP